MSAGRSIATDLPMPSGMKWEVESLAATWSSGALLSAISGTPLSAALTGGAATTAPRIRAATAALRIKAVDMSPWSPRSSSRCDRRADPEAHDVHRIALQFVGIADVRLAFAGVGDAA